MNILLVPLGSHGDVHPFVGLGVGLRARGHRVRVIINPFFVPLVEKVGLETIPLGTAEDYTSTASNPDLWKPVKGTRIVFQHLVDFIAPVYEKIAAANIPGDTIVIASTLALGARVAEEKLQIPTATIHLQPSVLRSYIDPPQMPGTVMGPHVPRWLMAMQWYIVDRWVVDPIVGKGLNAFRGQLGLPPVQRILRDYIHSPRLTIGLFPDWFAPPQADWPASVRLTGFPLYDEAGLTPMSPELCKFLDDGPPPIAFTFGSAMWHARELLEQSARACTLLGRRGILLTRHRENLPARLPVGVKHFDYAPFSELLPRCAALVHHGGIGTASQGLCAGVPQLVLPHAHDQLDNATRLRRLGIASFIAPKHYKADHAAQKLGDLIGSEAMARKCLEVQEKFVGKDAIGETCGLIEGLCETRISNDEIRIK